jgi:N-acetylmuramoyl-L-alanine amidase
LRLCQTSIVKTTLIAALFVLLSACTAAPVRSPLAEWAPSPNHNARGPILVVLHFTSQQSMAQSLHTLRTRNSGGPVSAHYLVGEDGRILQLVSDDRRAWHAGPGRWGTITDINSTSIGIELDNDGEEPFPPAQFEALVKLLEDLCTRHGIPRRQVIGHADMAPDRKIDPGKHFPWQALAGRGFGAWPQDRGDPPPGFDAMAALACFGYPMADPEAAVRAFHLRFRGRDDLPAVLDAEDARRLHGLALAPAGAGTPGCG